MDKTITRETLSLLFKIASIFMLVSLFEINYMEELFTGEEGDKLMKSLDQICQKFLDTTFV